jgi:protein gp37
VCSSDLDLFAEQVPDEMIRDVLLHCHRYPTNTYVYQTKNPVRFLHFKLWIPKGSWLGCTIETNRPTRALGISTAPDPLERARQIGSKSLEAFKRFITIEPILDFDPLTLIDWLEGIKPDFVNIGADSKRHGLDEPSPDKIRALVKGLQDAGITIKKKHNQVRLVPEYAGVSVEDPQ